MSIQSHQTFVNAKGGFPSLNPVNVAFPSRIDRRPTTLYNYVLTAEVKANPCQTIEE